MSSFLRAGEQGAPNGDLTSMNLCWRFRSCDNPAPLMAHPQAWYCIRLPSPQKSQSGNTRYTLLEELMLTSVDRGRTITEVSGIWISRQSQYNFGAFILMSEPERRGDPTGNKSVGPDCLGGVGQHVQLNAVM